MDLENRQQLQSSIKNGMTGRSSAPTETTTNFDSMSKNSSLSSDTMKKPANKMPLKMIIGVAVLVLTIVGGAAGFLLSETRQDIRQQASVADYNIEYCTTFGTTTCIDGVRYRCESPGTRYAKIEPEETCSRVTCTQSEIDQCQLIGRTCSFNSTTGRGQCSSGGANTCTTAEVEACEAIGRVCEFNESTGNGRCVEEETRTECTQDEIDLCERLGRSPCTYDAALGRGQCASDSGEKIKAWTTNAELNAQYGTGNTVISR